MLIYYRTLYTAYFLITIIFVLSVVLKEKPRHKIVSFFLLAWLVTFNSFRSESAWNLLPFLFHFKRGDQILGLALIVFMILSFFSKKGKTINIPIPKYEKYLYYYIISSVFLFYLHRWLGNITFERSAYFSRIYITGLILFYVTKKIVSKEFIRATIKVIVYMGVVSSFVSIIQFFIDEHFLRISHLHNAFPGYYRVSGIFRTPYDHALFIILTIFVAFYYIQDLKIKTITISLLFSGLALTFGRSVWLAFLFTILYHLYNLYRHSFRKILLLTVILSFLFLISIGSYLISKGFFSGDIFTERIFADTVSVRFGYYGFILKSIPKSPLIGFGDVQNNQTYFEGMIALNQGLFWALGKEGGIHNLILEEAFIRGLVVLFFFLSFFLRFFSFCTNQCKKTKSYIFCFPNYFLMAFFIFELSVSGFLVSNSGFLTMFFAAIVSGIYQKQIDFGHEFEIKGIQNIHMSTKVNDLKPVLDE